MILTPLLSNVRRQAQSDGIGDGAASAVRSGSCGANPSMASRREDV